MRLLVPHILNCINSETEHRKNGELPTENEIYTLKDVSVRSKLTGFILTGSTGTKIVC